MRIESELRVVSWIVVNGHYVTTYDQRFGKPDFIERFFACISFGNVYLFKRHTIIKAFVNFEKRVLFAI